MSYTGSDLIAEGLASLGVKHVFGIVSIHNMTMFDAINRLGKTKIIDVRHEQAGTHAADGYARATGGLGVVMASTGPGTSNTVTGLYEAGVGSSKVMVITSQAETAFYGKGLSYVHEAENQVPMLESVCRRVESPRHIDQLGPAFNAVVDDIFTGRAQPGALEIPIDIQYAEASPFEFVEPRQKPFPPNQALLEQALERLRESRRRVIIAGGGVIAANASDALRALAEQLQCPVITTVDGRGVIPEDHPLCVGNYYNTQAGAPGVYESIAEADLTLAIGTKFAVGVDGNFQKKTPPGALIQIDIDPNMIGRTHRLAIGIQADAGEALDAINGSHDEFSANDERFNQTVWAGRDSLRAATRQRLGPDWPLVMDKTRATLPRDGIFVRDQTISAYTWGNQLFPIYEPRTSINPTSGAIGPGFPMALGAAVATGKKTVVIHGDGGFLYHATELATAAQYQIPVVVCVFNDQGYGVLRWLQDTRIGRINETDLGKVDFTGLAKSLGVPGERVTSVAGYSEAIERSMAAGGPYLLDIDMEHFAPSAISMMPKKAPN